MTITKHKDLSERFVLPEMNSFLKAARNLYLYGVEKEEMFGAIRKEIHELEEAGIPMASPRSEGAEISDKEPQIL